MSEFTGAIDRNRFSCHHKLGGAARVINMYLAPRRVLGTWSPAFIHHVKDFFEKDFSLVRDGRLAEFCN